MYEIQKKDDIPSTQSLSKLGITAIGYAAGGVFFILLQAFSGLKGLGFIVGGIVCLLGIISLMSKDAADKKAGAVITAAGALVLLSKVPGVAPFASTLLTIGTVGLLAMGIINGIKFFIGLKKRS